MDCQLAKLNGQQLSLIETKTYKHIGQHTNVNHKNRSHITTPADQQKPTIPVGPHRHLLAGC